MVIFLDTEFTDRDEPYLISIGLHTDARSLYVEIAGAGESNCSTFVVDVVLPLLEGKGMSPQEVGHAVGTFLATFEEPITFFCEDPRYDIELLRPFIPSGLIWSYAVPSFETEEEEARFDEAHKVAYASGLRQHHALDDARALCAAWDGRNRQLT